VVLQHGESVRYCAGRSFHLPSHSTARPPLNVPFFLPDGWRRAQVVDEPSFFHQWQSDALLEQYTEQQIAVAFGGNGGLDLDLDLDHGVATPLLQRVPAPAADHRPRKAAKVNASWDSCVTEQGSPEDYSSPTILSFGGHHAKAPKQELLDAAAAALPSFQQARPAPKRSYDDMMAEAARAPAAAARPASQNQDHILAERKRREKLSQRFIALSKIVPGLKKVRVRIDTSVQNPWRHAPSTDHQPAAQFPSTN
jgi:hypothetical protein